MFFNDTLIGWMDKLTPYMGKYAIENRRAMDSSMELSLSMPNPTQPSNNEALAMTPSIEEGGDNSNPTPATDSIPLTTCSECDQVAINKCLSPCMSLLCSVHSISHQSQQHSIVSMRDKSNTTDHQLLERFTIIDESSEENKNNTTTTTQKRPKHPVLNRIAKEIVEEINEDTHKIKSPFRW